MSKDTVLELTLTKEPNPIVMKEPLDAPKSPQINTQLAPLERIHNTGTDLNGFGNTMKDQLLPSAPVILDIDRNGLSSADTDRLEMLSNDGEKKPEHFGEDDELDFRMGDDEPAIARDGHVGSDDGKWQWHDADEPDYPYDGVHDDNRTAVPTEKSPNVNTYQQKKNLAQGMMDLALLSANANQLRYVMESSSGGHPYYYSSITLISFSIILQIAVGVGLILNSRYDVNHHIDICKADKINNMTVLGVFLVTIVNVFITSFSVAPSNSTAILAG